MGKSHPSVMVFGTFDRLHPGHEYFLDEASKHGSLKVVVARDENVMKIKGHLPVENEKKRAKEIKKGFPDAKVIPGDPKDFLGPVRKFKPDVIFLGYDQKLPPGLKRKDLKCRIKRARSYMQHRFKSSLHRPVCAQELADIR